MRRGPGIPGIPAVGPGSSGGEPQRASWRVLAWPGAPAHLRVRRADEPARPRQGHRRSVPAPGRPPPRAPLFRPSPRTRPSAAAGGGAPRNGAPCRAARRRLGRRVVGSGSGAGAGGWRGGRAEAGRAGAWAGAGPVSPGNGAGYGASPRTNRAASLSAPRFGHPSDSLPRAPSRPFPSKSAFLRPLLSLSP